MPRENIGTAIKYLRYNFVLPCISFAEKVRTTFSIAMHLAIF